MANKNKILVTGGSGFIGGYVLRHFLARGYEVGNFDMRPSTVPGVKNIVGSILDKNLVDRTVAEYDDVFHFAGFANINNVKNDPVGCLELNIIGTARFLDAMKGGGKTFYLASSVYVHDQNGHFYTSSKAAAEAVCRNYWEMFKVPSRIVRLGTVYGEQSRMEDVISIFVRRALAGEPLTVHGGGTQVRHFIHGDDIAEGCEKLLHLKDEGTILLVFAGVEEVSILQLAEEVRRQVPGVQLRTEPAAVRTADYSGAIEGREATYALLDWKPRVTLAEGVRRVIEGMKK